jgi:hypothetical protein
VSGPLCRSSRVAPLARKPIALRSQDNWVEQCLESVDQLVKGVPSQ